MLELRADDPPAPWLAHAVAIGLYEAVEEVAPDLDQLQLKWPNDLLVGAAKLAGILLERQGAHIVIGVGVNLGWAPVLADRSTTSLADLGRTIAVDRFAPVLAAHMADAVADWRNSSGRSTREQWLARAHPVGTLLSRHDGEGKRLTGCFDGLEDDGSLRLRASDGTMSVISSGEVMLG